MWPQLLERFPSIAGAKLTDPTPDLVRTIIHARPEFNILGSETSIIELWPHGARSVAAWISYAFPALRSEEHTSELQSHRDLVCRLLLEQKKKKEEKPQSDKQPPPKVD